jgi:circadian clock protein KaiB
MLNEGKVTNFDDNDKLDNQDYKLRLFITGASPNSVRALTNLKNICADHLTNGYDLEIIDIYQQPEKAETEQIIAVPLLLKLSPLPERRMIGDLSDTEKVLRSLGLRP